MRTRLGPVMTGRPDLQTWRHHHTLPARRRSRFLNAANPPGCCLAVWRLWCPCAYAFSSSSVSRCPSTTPWTWWTSVATGLATSGRILQSSHSQLLWLARYVARLRRQRASYVLPDERRRRLAAFARHALQRPVRSTISGQPGVEQTDGARVIQRTPRCTAVSVRFLRSPALRRRWR